LSDEKTDIDAIRNQVEEREKKERELAGGSGSGKNEGRPKITSRFVQDCLYANELGDGMLYAAIHQDQFLYNKSTTEWMSWAGHFWERDIMAKSLASVENVSKRYLEEASDLVDKIGAAAKSGKKDRVQDLQKVQDNIYKRVGRLRSERGRTNCLKFAHTNIENSIAIKGDELDMNPWLLACQNGVIDLRTGKLRPGRPDDLISKASPFEFDGIETPAPVWELTLKQILQDDQKMTDYIARLLGYGATGLNIEHFLPIFYGQGRNGKGVILETISHVLGDLAAPIQAEMLLDQGRAKNSSGPSPDIMGLRGLRVAFASETDEGRRFSVARVRWLTGGDTLKGRHPHDKYETEFTPTHILILMTNSKPSVSDDSFAFWERVHLIEFNLSFVDREPEKENERPADKHLREKLLKEAPGILAWLVRGCLEWQRIGLDPPDKVKDATKEYRRDEDLMGHFLEECCYENPDAETKAVALYDRFVKWWDANVSRKKLSKKKFGMMIGKKFKKRKSGTYSYFGVGLLPDTDED
jgi:putative DNA primase/helicase